MAHTDLTNFYRVLDTLIADHQEVLLDESMDALATYIMSTRTDADKAELGAAMVKLGDKLKETILADNERWVAQSWQDGAEARAERREADRAQG